MNISSTTSSSRSRLCRRNPKRGKGGGFKAGHKFLIGMKPVKDPRQNSDPSLFSWTNAWEKVWSCCYLNMQKLFIGCFGATSRQWKLPPGYEDPTVLTSETMFTVSEIEALYELFKKLSSSVIDDGQIHKEEFKLALLRNGKRKDLIADRVFELFDVKQNGVIGFGEFVRSLSIFHPEARFEDKVSYAFKMYDLRQTGFIDREEVEQMIRALMMESDVELLDEVVSTILDKTFTEVDTKKDGKIDEEEWKAYVMKNPALMKNMSLPYLMDLTTSFPRFYISREESDK